MIVLIISIMTSMGIKKIAYLLASLVQNNVFVFLQVSYLVYSFVNSYYASFYVKSPKGLQHEVSLWDLVNN